MLPIYFMFKCNRLGLLLSLLLMVVHLFAENSGKGNIKGTLKDEAGNPLTNLSVSLQNTTRGTVSDENGDYELRNVPEGVYMLIVSAVNVQHAQKEITVLAGKTTEANFVLSEMVMQLDEIAISAQSRAHHLQRLADVENNAIYAGKKTEVLVLDKLNANLALNVARQVYAKTPGITVWENDGSGIQTGIASRGLSPNRSWEFNMRQNGYDISPDIFGYPETYYTPPLEAVEQVQVVRGAASLQYGPQFGGLVNYVTKKGAAGKPVSVENKTTVGSYGMLNSFTGIGGAKGKLNYYAWYHHRSAEGWRDNGAYRLNDGHMQVSYALSGKVKIGAEYSRLNYVCQQPGGLTDVLFEQDARQSLRARNWFNTPWNVVNVYTEAKYGRKNAIKLSLFGVIAERNSIGFVAAITNPDTINTATGMYAARQIDRDRYRTFGLEVRNINHYNLFGAEHTLATGVRIYRGNTLRQQQGKGDTGTGFNLLLQADAFNRQLDFNTFNTAVFAENLFRIGNNLTVTPGFRVEYISSDISGRLKFNPDGSEDLVPDAQQNRFFVLGGIGAEYKLLSALNLYANVSQAYRPVMYSDLTPPATTDEIDPNLKDASGFNADLGIRGKTANFLTYDVSAFYLHYSNRIGNLTRLNPDGSRYQFRTNIGASVSRGVEAYLEFDPLQAAQVSSKVGYLSLFASLAYINAIYTDFATAVFADGQIQTGNLKNKRVENAPQYINRVGATYSIKKFSATWQYSMVGNAYADAANTETPSANGVNGLIPAYNVMDLSANFGFAKHYTIGAGINNLTDSRFFTRRAGGYPGPGLLPSDGRTAYFTLGIKL